MCEPMSASLALMAAGTAAQMHGQKKAQKAMNNAQEAEALRQKKLRQEGEGIFAESLNRLGAENQTAEIDAAGKKRGEQMAASQETTAPVEIKQQGDAPSVVSDDASARVSAATGKARQRALAEGFLGGFGDVSLSNALQNARANQGIGILNNMRQGSEQALGYEMNNASMAGDRWNNIGKGLQVAGALTGMYGAMAPASAATSAGNTAVSGALEASQAKSIADAAAGMSGMTPGIQSVMNGGSFLTGTGVAPAAGSLGGLTLPSFLPSTMQTGATLGSGASGVSSFLPSMYQGVNAANAGMFMFGPGNGASINQRNPYLGGRTRIT